MVLAGLPKCFACLLIRRYRIYALVGLATGRSLDVRVMCLIFFFLKELTFWLF